MSSAEATRAGRGSNRSAMATAMPSATPKRVLGPYHLVEEIGRGGMACVYLAQLEGMAGFRRTVVVKAMRASLLNNPEITDMFRAEAILSAQLNHPNIVRVHDFGVDDEVPYLVMEHLDGWDLERAWVRQRATGRAIPVECAVLIVREIMNALAYAHDFTDADGAHRAIVHRDVSPSNVMLSKDGTVRLLDFGIAKVKGGLSKTTGQVLRGKYGYLAPEQVEFRQIDHRVDIFSAGIVLWELLTGRPAFRSKDDAQTLDRIAAAKIEPPSKYNSTVSPALDGIMLRALARDPKDRFQSAREMADALTEETGGSSFSLSMHLDRLFGDDDDEDERQTTVRPRTPPRGTNAPKATPSRPAKLHSVQAPSRRDWAAPPSAKPVHVAGAAAATLAMSPVHEDDLRPVDANQAPPPAEPQVVRAQAVAQARKRRAGWPILFVDLVAVLAVLWFCPNPTVQAVVARVRPHVEHVIAVGLPYANVTIEPLFPLDHELAPVVSAQR
jgi:serine/threonine protein kinase